jgi:hypothetical protein
VSSRRLRRPVLACRWQKAPSGALECIWHIAAVDARVAEDPAIRRLPRPAGWQPAIAAALLLL